MKQLSQFYRDGHLEVSEVPFPCLQPGRVLVRTAASLVSMGTEKYMLELARKSLVGKALARPDLVRQVIAKAVARRSRGERGSMGAREQRSRGAEELGSGGAGERRSRGDRETKRGGKSDMD